MRSNRGTKKERAEYIRKRSLELANSGKCIDHYSVERALVREGYSEARQELDNNDVRRELDDLCKQARQRK